jgi:hypothetical protein
VSGAPLAEASAVAWDPAAAVARACALPDGDPRRRVLKRDRRTLVVWLDDGGPAGEAVVVKQIAVRSLVGGIAARLFGSPAAAQRRGAELLRSAGIEVAAPLGVIESRDAHGAKASAYVSRAVVDAAPLREAFLARGRRERRLLARALGALLARLHSAGIYVPDLRDANLLVRRAPEKPSIVLVDLDRVRRPPGGVTARRRVMNLVQLDRTLGWFASARERLTLLVAYRRALPRPWPRLSRLAAQVNAARRRKDREVARRRWRAGIVPDERLPISCLIVCGNEIAHIRECLESVRWCDEIVAVDSLSTDGTADVCREYTDKLFQRPWPGYVAQKQFALEQATHPWALNIDADERVSPQLRAEIEAVLAHDGRGYDCFTMPRLVFYLGRWWRRGGWYPDRRVRLFRRAGAVWGGIDPHERVIARGSVGRLHGPLWHFTYDDIDDHIETIQRFTTQAAESAARRGRRASIRQLVANPFGRFLRFFLASGGFTMGFPGLFVAITAAFYVHLKYAKLDEKWSMPERRG